MTTQMALFLLGVFFLILASSAQEACRLDAAMTVRNEESDLLTSFLFRGSRMFQVFVDDSSPGELIKGKEYPIKLIWRNWTEEKISWTMTWFNEFSIQAIATIGNLKTIHWIRFNEKNEKILDTYKTWNKNSLVNLDVNGNSPSRAVFISSFQPGYLWMYHKNTKSASWKLITIDSSGTVWPGGSSNSKNPEIEPWLKRIIDSNLTIIGVLKTGRNEYCRGKIVFSGCVTWSYWHILEKIPFDWEESVVVFIEHDKQTRHCFGEFRHDSEKCTEFSEYELTNTSIFGCDGKGVDLQSTTASSKTSTVQLPLETKEMPTEKPPTDNGLKKINWILIFIAAGFLFSLASCLIIYLQNKKNPYRYELVKTSPTSRFIPHFRGELSSESKTVSSGSESEDKSSGKTKKKKKKKKKQKKRRSPSNVKLRRARDLMNKFSDSSESAEKSGGPSKFQPRKAKDLMGKDLSDSSSSETSQNKSVRTSDVKPRRAKDLMGRFSDSSDSEKTV